MECGVDRPTLGPGLRKSARRAAGATLLASASTPSAPAGAAGPSAPFRPGRGGTRAQGRGHTGTAHEWGLDSTEPRGPVCPRMPITARPQAPFCPAALTRIYRQQRRHLGGALTAPRAHRSPGNGGGCPGRHLNRKEPHWSAPNCTLSPHSSTKTQKTCSGSQRSIFPGLFPFK